MTVPKTVALPLGYTPMVVEGSGFEPPNPKERIYSPPRLARLRYPSITLNICSSKMQIFQIQHLHLRNVTEIERIDVMIIETAVRDLREIIASRETQMEISPVYIGYL